MASANSESSDAGPYSAFQMMDDGAMYAIVIARQLQRAAQRGVDRRARDRCSRGMHSSPAQEGSPQDCQSWLPFATGAACSCRSSRRKLLLRLVGMSAGMHACSERAPCRCWPRKGVA